MQNQSTPTKSTVRFDYPMYSGTFEVTDADTHTELGHRVTGTLSLPCTCQVDLSERVTYDEVEEVLEAYGAYGVPSYDTLVAQIAVYRVSDNWACPVG